MAARSELATRLRDRILSELHLGRLHAGDRLPSIRELAGHIGADQRAVAQVYRLLEAEGLVEVRGRSGVYVAPQDRFGGELLAETARWVAETLTDAWKRRIRVSDFPEFVRRCTVQVRLRCACVESTEDDLTWICGEMREDFGLDSYPVDLSALLISSGKVDLDGLHAELRDADLVVTSAFHAGQIRTATVGKPLVSLSLHPDLVDTVRHRLNQGPLTLVIADPRFGNRMLTLHGGEGRRERIHIVLADDVNAISRLDRSEPVFLTRAARKRLGDVDLPLIAPHSPSLSAESARELMELLIRLNMEAERQR